MHSCTEEPLVNTRRGNLAIYESTNISETKEVTPTNIGVHVCYINPYLHDFLSQF